MCIFVSKRRHFCSIPKFFTKKKKKFPSTFDTPCEKIYNFNANCNDS